MSSNLGCMGNIEIYFGFPLSDPLVSELLQTPGEERIIIVLPLLKKKMFGQEEG